VIGRSAAHRPVVLWAIHALPIVKTPPNTPVNSGRFSQVREIHKPGKQRMPEGPEMTDARQGYRTAGLRPD
jgi:hypothetical protein